MGIKAVNQVPFGVSCESSIGPDGKAIYTYHDKWQVITDNIHDEDVVAICQAGGQLPALGLDRPGFVGILRCSHIEAHLDNDCPTLFHVDVIWKTVRSTTDTWNVKIESDHVEREFDVFYLIGADGAAYPLVNSLGAHYDPTIKESIYDEEISVDFECLAVAGNLISATRGACNTDTVTFNVYGVSRSFPPYTVKFARCRYSTVWGDGIPYWRVSLRLHIKLSQDENAVVFGWKRRLVDKGFLTVLYPALSGSITGTDYVPDYSKKPQIVAPGRPNSIQDHFNLDGAGHLLDVWTTPDTPPKVIFRELLPRSVELMPLLAGIAPTPGTPTP